MSDWRSNWKQPRQPTAGDAGHAGDVSASSAEDVSASLETEGQGTSCISGNSSTNPKARAEAGLLGMVDVALDVIQASLDSKQVARGQQTRSSDAWRVLDAVLQLGKRDAEEKPLAATARLDPEAAVVELRKRLEKR